MLGADSQVRKQVYWNLLAIVGFLLVSNIQCHKFFPMKISSLHWNDAAYTRTEKLWWKVTGETQMSWSPFFYEMGILLCQSILETTRILFIYLFVYSIFTVDKFTIKTNIILYTNKNSNILIIKNILIHVKLANKNFLKFKF